MRIIHIIIKLAYKLEFNSDKVSELTVTRSPQRVNDDEVVLVSVQRRAKLLTFDIPVQSQSG